MAFGLRHYIDLVEGNAQEWGVSYTPLFNDALKRHRQTFPDLPEKIQKFIDVKLQNPLSMRYGKHDRPFTGPLVGFWHCHLRDDAILIYNLKNRALNLVVIVSHNEIEGKRAKSVVNQLAPFK